MKHFNYLTEEQTENLFVKPPEEFNKYTDKETLAFGLGATLYMPSYQNIIEKVKSEQLRGLASFVMCFEDAIKEEDLDRGQENVRKTLQELYRCIAEGKTNASKVPLFFLRVRNIPQFESFISSLSKEEAELLTGFIFPKFDSSNGSAYLSLTKQFNEHFQTKLYGMPILESPSIIFKESRVNELIKIKAVVDEYRDYVLNIRVGGTDFSSVFALRRGIDYSIYDIKVVSDCLTDILNVFKRADDGYVLSAPVWEYFSQQRLLKPRIRMTPFMEQNMMGKRQKIVDKAIDGLIKEIVLDKANGFVGKTIIHPTHISFVNALQAVTKEEYEDAQMILQHQGGGVFKSSSGNKMNEINPHLAWARQVVKKADVYGVLKEGDNYVALF